MNNKPTPVTDEEALLMNLDCDDSCATVYIKRGGLVVYGDFVLGDFARKLERELAEAWELLASEEITRNHIIQRGIEMQQELAEAREWQNVKVTKNGETHCLGTLIELLERELAEAREKNAKLISDDLRWYESKADGIILEFEQLKEETK